MTKVTLLGDSIRLIGYGTEVPRLLGEDYTVYQPEDNCRFSKYTLRGILCEWAEDISGSDIIHWNNGLWDIYDAGDGALTPPDEYVSNMMRIATLLKSRAKKVIFATTTPVIHGHIFMFNDRIAEYNALITPKLMNMGIAINDLHSLVYHNIDEYICDDSIHLSAAGIDACADKVVNSIKSEKNLL